MNFDKEAEQKQKPKSELKIEGVKIFSSIYFLINV